MFEVFVFHEDGSCLLPKCMYSGSTSVGVVWDDADPARKFVPPLFSLYLSDSALDNDTLLEDLGVSSVKLVLRKCSKEEKKKDVKQSKKRDGFANKTLGKDIIIHKDKILGKGRGVVVYVGELINSAKGKVAVKVFQETEDMLSELESLEKLKFCLNVVPCLGYSDTGRFIVFAHMNMGSLKNWLIKENPNLGSDVVKTICMHIIHGMKSVSGAHLERKTLHRDLSSNNVLLSDEGLSVPNVYIGDFGESVVAGESFAGFSTLSYASPELLRNDSLIDIVSDIWSFGVILWELLSYRSEKRYCDPSVVFGKYSRESLVNYYESNVSSPLLQEFGLSKDLFFQVLCDCLKISRKDRICSWEKLLEAFEQLKCDKSYLVERLQRRAQGFTLPLFGRTERLPMKKMVFPALKKKGARNLMAEEDFYQFLRNNQVVRITGPAGFGKTSLCKFIAWRWACEEDNAWQEECCVVYIALGEAMEKMKGQRCNFVNFLKTYFEDENQSVDDIDTFLLQMENILFVFDSLDEGLQNSDDSGKHFLRDLTAGKIERIKRMVICGRSEGKNLVNGQEIELLGLNEAKMTEYVSNYFESEQRQKFVMSVMNDPSLKHFNSPLTLQLVCSLFSGGDSDENTFIPVSLTQLYQSVITRIVFRGLHYLKDEAQPSQLAISEEEEKVVPLIKYSVDDVCSLFSTRFKANEEEILKLRDQGIDGECLTLLSEQDCSALMRIGTKVRYLKWIKEEMEQKKLDDSYFLRDVLETLYSVDWKSKNMDQIDGKMALLLKQCGIVKQVSYSSTDENTGMECLRCFWEFYHTSFFDFFEAQRMKRVFEREEHSTDVLRLSSMSWQFLIGLTQNSPQHCKARVWNALYSNCYRKWNIRELFQSVELKEWQTYGERFSEENISEYYQCKLTLCNVLHRLFSPKRALEDFRSLVSELEQETKKEQIEEDVKVHIYYNAGWAYCDVSDVKESLRCLEMAKNIQEQSKRENTTLFAVTLNMMGCLLHDQNRLEEALNLFLSVKKITEETVGRENMSFAASINNIAGIKRSQGKIDEALSLFFEAMYVTEKCGGKETEDFGTALNNVANCFHDKGMLKEALETFEKSKKIVESIRGRNSEHVAICCHNIANVYFDQRRYNESLSFYFEAGKIYKQTIGINSEKYLSCVECMTKIVDGIPPSVVVKERLFLFIAVKIYFNMKLESQEISLWFEQAPLDLIMVSVMTMPQQTVLSNVASVLKNSMEVRTRVFQVLQKKQCSETLALALSIGEHDYAKKLLLEGNIEVNDVVESATSNEEMSDLLKAKRNEQRNKKKESFLTKSKMKQKKNAKKSKKKNK